MRALALSSCTTAYCQHGRVKPCPSAAHLSRLTCKLTGTARRSHDLARCVASASCLASHGQWQLNSRRCPTLQIWLVAVGFSCIINLILIVVALVSPTPQFASNVLFRLKTIESASLTRRWFPPEPVDGDEDREPILTTLPPQPNTIGLAGPVKRSDDWISEDWNVECKVDREQYLCRVWDPSLGTWQTQGPSTAQPTSTEATTVEATTTVLSDSLTTSPPTMTRTSRPTASPTTRTGTTAPRPSPSAGGNDTLPGDFVTLWVGDCLDPSPDSRPMQRAKLFPIGRSDQWEPVWRRRTCSASAPSHPCQSAPSLVADITLM